MADDRAQPNVGGRPTLCTPERQRIIVETIRTGATQKAAAERAGVSTAAIQDWNVRGEKGEEPFAGFAAAYKKAEGDLIAECAALIRKAALDGTWPAAAWLLERRYPADYGRRDKVDANVALGGEVAIHHDFGKHLTDADIAAELTAGSGLAETGGESPDG